MHVIQDEIVILGIYIQMQYINLILIVLPAASAIACSNFYDYTKDTVSCTQSCPPGAKIKNNNCLTDKQYLIGSEVHLCERGWVDELASLCCPKSYYPISYNNQSVCVKCPTKILGNGKLCCPSSFYTDLSNPDSSKCTPIGTGNCALITMRNIFRVCCPFGTFYHIQEQRCVAPASYNCESTQKICCGLGKKLQYIQFSYKCVPYCSWADKNTFYCSKKYCSNSNEIIQTNALFSKTSQNSLVSLGLMCCLGKQLNGNCIKEKQNCQKRFMNRGWAICCKAGQFYSTKSNQCTEICDGIILMQFFCTSQGNILNLQNGQPIEMQVGSLCNGKKVLQQFPFCCPPGSYINDTQGCKVCNGRIFRLNDNQICCAYDQIFNEVKSQCQKCDGITNKDGTLCCMNHQYFGYSQSGSSRCVDECPQQQMYQTNYCCQSLANFQCPIKVYIPTSCSSVYYQEQSCQICPNFCSAPPSCMLSDASNSQCQKICSLGTVLSIDLGQCLACDAGCEECTQPFDSKYCSKCKFGYTYLQGQCNRCSPECETCSLSVNTCLSCSTQSSRPVFVNSRCIPYCGGGKYFEYSNATCVECPNGCKDCIGSNSQCSKCSASMYLSSLMGGSCSSCSTGCISCFLSPNRCFQCSSNLVLDQQSQCIQSCPPGTASLFDASIGHNSCRKCHSSCLSCQWLPQNCLTCSNSSYFLNDQLGINLCSLCMAPCKTCSSASTCLSCQSSYFVENGQCSKCHSSCQTCSSGGDLGCLSCFGQSQLVSGKCVGCSSSCQKCDIDQNCQLCKSGFYMYNGNCATQCPDRSFISNNKCTDCLTNCSTCVNSSQCLTCAPTHPIQFNSLCLKQCPANFQLQANRCVYIKNNTNTTNNTNNTNNINNTNNTNITNNTNSTNNNGSSGIGDITRIENQVIEMKKEGNKVKITTTVSGNSNNAELDFFLYNTKTNTSIKLPATKIPATQAPNLALKSTTSNDVVYEVQLPQNQTLRDSILLTSAKGNPNSTTYFNGHSILDFILYDYINDPLQGLQYIGLTFTVLIIIFAIVTKLKGHFLAEQSNTIILHMLNFIQVVYLFKFTQVHSEGMYHFLNGFGFMHFLMFPNFFYSAIPSDYYEYPAERSLIPDANFIRSAGSSISFLLIVLLLTAIASIISLMVFKLRQLEQMPQIRKVTRVGILAAHITFMNIVFTAATYLFQPFVASSLFTNACRVAAVILIIVIPLLCIAICFHFYKTYNSDVLEHYYTLRQAAHYILIICQALIFSLSIGKPLICLTLIILQIAWFLFNFYLYKYGQGDKLKMHVKFVVSTVAILIAYLFLSLSGFIPWVVITVFVGLVVAILIVYSIYQIIGLYYHLLFKVQAKGSEQGIQTKQLKQDTDKESASRL